jgi:hypothetical protein
MEPSVWSPCIESLALREPQTRKLPGATFEKTFPGRCDTANLCTPRPLPHICLTGSKCGSCAEEAGYTKDTHTNNQ